MQENEKERDQNGHEPVQTPETVSVFRNAWEIEAAARRKEELAERQRQAEAEEAAYQAREEYARELAEEKVDLIRLKQGVISESDKVFPEQAPPKKYTVWQKIGNWFYHAKWWLGIAVFCVLVGAYLIYDYVAREDPDLRILVLSDQTGPYLYTEQLTDWLEPLCADYDGDGKTIVQSVAIPVSENNMNQGSYASSYNTQLLIQFQSAMCMLVLTDTEAEPYLQPDEMFVDLSELYPDCAWTDGWRLVLDDTDFAEQVGFTEPLREGTCLALRVPQASISSEEETKTAYDNAKALLDTIIEQLHTREGADSSGTE